MRVRTALTAAVLTVVLTACGGGGDSASDEPAPEATTAPTSPAEARQACIDAIAAQPTGENGEIPSEPVPPACESLDEGAYLDAYMDVIQQGNQEGRDALQDLIDEAAEDDQQ